MMEARIACGKFVFILFFCFALISQLEAAPRNGTVDVLFLYMDGVSTCEGNTGSAILDIVSRSFDAAGICKENGIGPDINYNISASFTNPAPGTGNITGTLTQSLNGGVNSNFNFTGAIQEQNDKTFDFGIFDNVFTPFIVSGEFEALTCTKDGTTKSPTETAIFYNVQNDSASCANHSQVQTCGNESEFNGDTSYQFASCSVVAVEPIPTLSEWAIILLIFLLSITVYFKGIKQS